MRQGQQRPVDDIAVRVPGPNAALALEEHEPLRPVAIGVLLTKYPQQQVTEGRELPDGQQQLHGTLGDITGAPAAARILLESSRSQEVDQCVVGKPWQDFGHAAHGFRRPLGKGQPRRRFAPVGISGERRQASGGNQVPGDR